VKVGDLVRVFEPLACGGLSIGAVGLILDEDNSQLTTPRWTIMWMYNNEIFPGTPMKESVTYGNGVEVISES
tara:strand:- start:1385 stop:1600 length:216 start_codon:yes stop_codon:yes gene_type:complete